MTHLDSSPQSHPRYVVVGPGFHFQSGLSVYTYRLAYALATHHECSVLLLRRLVPKRLYPGRKRVGASLTNLRYSGQVTTLAELDWYWGPRILQALYRLWRTRPDAMVLQWWTAATLHTYLMLAVVARCRRIEVIVEFHEVQDSGEARLPLAAHYCRKIMPALLALTTGVLVHNENDLSRLRETYGHNVIDRSPIEIAPHGPYDHLVGTPMSNTDTAERSVRDDSVTNLLFFGLIRPYKGLEDVIRAFDSLTAEQAEKFHLSVVGETWEGWSLPAELIAASPYRHHITFVNHYVSDGAASDFFAAADAVVLPYRRGSASGPMHIAMSAGLHIVLYAVGGLVEAAADYEGAALLPPNDIDALRRALLDLPERRHLRFENPHSWSTTVAALDLLVSRTRPAVRPRS